MEYLVLTAVAALIGFLFGLWYVHVKYEHLSTFHAGTFALIFWVGFGLAAILTVIGLYLGLAGATFLSACFSFPPITIMGALLGATVYNAHLPEPVLRPIPIKIPDPPNAPPKSNVEDRLNEILKKNRR